MFSNAAKEHSGAFKELEAKRDKIKEQIRYHSKEQKRWDKYDTLDDDKRKRTTKR